MTVSSLAESWMGFPVKDYLECLESRQSLDYENTIYRIGVGYDTEVGFDELLRQFAEHPDAAQADRKSVV